MKSRKSLEDSAHVFAFLLLTLDIMKSVNITIEGKNYQLFYTNQGGHILTRLEQSTEETLSNEPMPEGENVTNLIFATHLFGKAEA